MSRYLGRIIWVLLICLSGCDLGSPAPEKPVVWVYSDLSDPRQQRDGGYPQNDPDDIVSMASLMLSANRYDIRQIVVGSTNRIGLEDPMPFVSEMLLNAYEHDQAALNESLGGFPETLPFIWSSITQQTSPIAFDSTASYLDLSELETVQALVDLASNEQVFVLNWGPLTESAMAVKHCLDTGNDAALRNMIFISHWTKSSLAQGSLETPFHVANCWDDVEACRFLHNEAGRNPLVRFIELGCVGQKGIVNGAAGFDQMETFGASRLGQIFITAKYYHQKPDFSDAATHWLLASGVGPAWTDYPSDGSLSVQEEGQFVQHFLDASPWIMDDLLHRSEIAARKKEPFSPEQLAHYFTYVYFNHFRNAYGMHLTQSSHVMISDSLGTVFFEGDFPKGDHALELETFSSGTYLVKVSGVDREFRLTVGDRPME
ncbi:nucleoside hydrolase-like domain-containing protein [Pontibacter sp. G13]|uniref:nucleoside hydrolase-like domain-containing protein n=1 Tax=Pontibacter sp. G13 TaxID=3074898 RepID=UPI002889F49C|nr:nucleoside hydrolase-like domain-containing protein [Pontibacter sp. G13]WNJ19127.1 hypothetical protein RJD25_01435 [Pontibacter sp. G13]